MVFDLLFPVHVLFDRRVTPAVCFREILQGPARAAKSPMGKGGKAAAAAAAAAAAEEASSRVGPNVVHGVRVTLAYLVLYYCFIIAQGSMKRKLRAYNAAHGKKVEKRSRVLRCFLCSTAVKFVLLRR